MTASCVDDPPAVEPGTCALVATRGVISRRTAGCGASPTRPAARWASPRYSATGLRGPDWVLGRQLRPGARLGDDDLGGQQVGLGRESLRNLGHPGHQPQRNPRRRRLALLLNRPRPTLVRPGASACGPIQRPAHHGGHRRRPGTAYAGWLSDSNPAGYAQYLRTFSIGHGWLSAPFQVSTAFGTPSVWPGDTFGISTLEPGQVALSWGSAASAGAKKSQIFAATVTAHFPP
jgi:hypothetical protein